MTFTIRDQACPNDHCAYFKKLNQGNVRIHSRKKGRLQCNSCKKTWSFSTGSLYYRLRHTPAQIEEALLALREGKGIRVVAKKLKVSASTVQAWKQKSSRNQ